jgi:hypothetical protein
VTGIVERHAARVAIPAWAVRKPWTLAQRALPVVFVCAGAAKVEPQVAGESGEMARLEGAMGWMP